MASHKVIVTQIIGRAGLEILQRAVEVAIAPRPTLAEILRLAPDADAFVVRGGPVSRQVIAAAPRLKVIGKHGVGVDNIDIAAATARGIPVFNTPGANSEAVAEMAFALMLALARQLRQAQHMVETDRFLEGKRDYRAVELQGKTLGLVGLGRIGRLVAQKCGLAFGMRVLAYDPYVTQPPALPGVAVDLVAQLADLLPVADFVSIHAPLTAQTRGIIGRQQLQMMKKSAYLVNTARGAVVDEAALVAALRAGEIAGAALDAFAQEPLPADSPLIGLDNVLLSPHVGGSTPEALVAMSVGVAEGVLAVLRGGRPENVLNPEVYERSPLPI